MAPFPETEIMTIKRLEVALRKMDLKLLKDGAYKLHEKFHSGYTFEYTDLLKELYTDVLFNSVIPEDIRDIIVPTMEDIFISQNINIDDIKTTDYQRPQEEAQNQQPNYNRVSSLTSLSYADVSSDDSQDDLESFEEKSIDEKLSAFEAFGSPNITQTIKKPEVEQEQVQNIIEQNAIREEVPQTPYNPLEQMTIAMTTKPPVQFEQNPSFGQNFKDLSQIQPAFAAQINNYPSQKSVAVFYGQDFSSEKTKNILKYKDLIFAMNDNHVSMADVLRLIIEINTQANTNVLNLKNVFDQFKLRDNKINFVTNSQSAGFISLLLSGGMKYSIYNPSSDTKINLIPMYGLTNLFRCCSCKEEYLDTQEFHVPLVVECPKCKAPMFPDFYTPDFEHTHINLDYYNASVIAFANSKIWLLVCPPMDDKISVNMLRSALKMSSQVEEIFILDRDINVRENLRRIFFDINNQVKINTHINSFEDFFNLTR